MTSEEDSNRDYYDRKLKRAEPCAMMSVGASILMLVIFAIYAVLRKFGVL